MFNSAQCIHELLSTLTFVRIHLGFQNILEVNASWHLEISSNKFKSIDHRMNDQRKTIALRTNVYQNNIFVIRQQSSAL